MKYPIETKEIKGAPYSADPAELGLIPVVTEYSIFRIPFFNNGKLVGKDFDNIWIGKDAEDILFYTCAPGNSLRHEVRSLAFEDGRTDLMSGLFVYESDSVSSFENKTPPESNEDVERASIENLNFNNLFRISEGLRLPKGVTTFPRVDFGTGEGNKLKVIIPETVTEFTLCDDYYVQNEEFVVPDTNVFYWRNNDVYGRELNIYLGHTSLPIIDFRVSMSRDLTINFHLNACIYDDFMETYGESFSNVSHGSVLTIEGSENTPASMSKSDIDACLSAPILEIWTNSEDLPAAVAEANVGSTFLKKYAFAINETDTDTWETKTILVRSEEGDLDLPVAKYVVLDDNGIVEELGDLDSPIILKAKSKGQISDTYVVTVKYKGSTIDVPLSVSLSEPEESSLDDGNGM